MHSWPDELPSPAASAALILAVLYFGAVLGGAGGPSAQAAARRPPITIALAAPAPTAAPTPAPAAPVHHSHPPAPAPVAPAPVAPVATTAPADDPTPTPTTTATPEPTPQPDPAQPPFEHVFVVWLAGPAPEATTTSYFDTQLRPQGLLLERYHGVGDGALTNGLALVAGRTRYREGDLSLADALANGGLQARAYQQEPCDAPVERNPLSYFHAECAPLDQLQAELAGESPPALSFIAPGPCDAGEPGTCPPGEPDGAARADSFLAAVAPAILQSPAYADGGALFVVFDQGDQRGALVVSPYTESGATSRRKYDHYALSRTLADIFGVEPLGRAGARGRHPFGPDIWAAQ